MKITSDLAAQILSRARTILHRDILVTDERGLVLSAGDYNSQIMVDSLRACQEGRIVRSSLGEDQIVWCPFIYENQSVGTFGVIEDGPHVTPEAISLLQGLAEVITHQHFLLEHIQPSEKMRSKFLKEVLSTPNLDTTQAYRQADILQMNLRNPQAVILIEIEGFERTAVDPQIQVSIDEKDMRISERAAELTEVIMGAFNHNPGNIASYHGKDLFVLCKGIGGDGLNLRNTMRFLIEKGEYVQERLHQKLSDKIISAGVGQYYPELGGLRKSYQEAKLSLSVGTKVWGAGRVYHIKQVGMFVTLANVAQERKAELAHQILYPLLRDDQLYKTVQTFLTSGLNLTEAAEKLHVHRNTLIYRLDKTKKVIGLDPRVFDDALQIKLGLMFYQEA